MKLNLSTVILAVALILISFSVTKCMYDKDEDRIKITETVKITPVNLQFPSNYYDSVQAPKPVFLLKPQKTKIITVVEKIPIESDPENPVSTNPDDYVEAVEYTETKYADVPYTDKAKAKVIVKSYTDGNFYGSKIELEFPKIEKTVLKEKTKVKSALFLSLESGFLFNDGISSQKEPEKDLKIEQFNQFGAAIDLVIKSKIIIGAAGGYDVNSQGSYGRIKIGLKFL